MQITKNLLFTSSSAKKIFNNIESGTSQVITGATIGEKTLLLSCIDRSIFVCEDLSVLSQVEEALKNLNKKASILTAIDENCILSDFADMTINYNLISAVCDFLLKKTDYLLILAPVLCQRLPSKELLLSKILNFNIGQNYNFDLLLKQLVAIGFNRTEFVTAKGDFSLRGDLLTIFPINSESPIRISFFDEEIEYIEKLSFTDMKVIEKCNSFDLYPAKIYFSGDKKVIAEQLIDSSKEIALTGEKLLVQQTKLEEALTKLENGQVVSFHAPCLNYNNNILDICACDANVVFDEPNRIFKSINFTLQSQLASWSELFQNGELLPIHKNFLLDKTNIFDFQAKSISVFSILKEREFNSYEQIELKVLGSQKYVFDFLMLCRDLKMLVSQNYKILLMCGDEQNKTIMQNFLIKNGIFYQEFSDKLYAENNANIYLLESYYPFSCSFLDGKFVVIGFLDLFKKRQVVRTSLGKKNQVFYLPKVGDYVVHSLHGIGKCIELKRMKLSGSEKDYFLIQYANGDLLYVPSEQADTISSYSGGDKEPKLNKLGGYEFTKIKEKVKSSVKELAINLLEIYAERDKKKGFKYSQDNELMEMFENAFQYEETADQLEAISQIKKDMISGKIMDRLICGDVGYGKTEVALRAVYKAVLDGKQVAFLCPTSILSQQHYDTCKSRFAEFMVNVQVLNRLKNKSQQAEIIKSLKEGSVDVIIGTHRLLSSDVQFKNLGLLVLDEEQRFGVADKEKIKNLKRDIDVLTLSATPIPRTLNMALTGIRDISIIETPPKDRMPIQTYVCEYSQTLLIDVIKREIARGGQVLVVYNRVESIQNFTGSLSAELEGVSIDYVHGQMPEKQLEKAIERLYSREIQVMVATTLIENGVDLPFANSLFVVNADKLGLSQLYQLRGRIGRSNKLAYAYFTYDGNREMTEDAYKRLAAIMEFTELGSGFKIAMRDLEIRGAGNVLGKEQHGHMQKVGYDMYTKLLSEVIEEIKGKKVEEKLPIKIDISAQAFISEKFIPNESERIKLYTSISEIDSLSNMQDIRKSIGETYGNLPEETIMLLYIALVKNLAQKLKVKRVIINQTTCALELYKNEDVINEKTTLALEKIKDVAVLKFKELPIIEFNLKNTTLLEKIKTVISFLNDASFS